MMTTPADRYRDLVGEHGDAELTCFIDELDQALRAPAPPPELHAALQHVLQQRIPPPPTSRAVEATPALTRKEALRAGAVAAGTAWWLTLGHTTTAMARAVARAAALETPMTATRLVEIMRAERANWESLLARVGAERMTTPGVEGSWSVTQIVAHLTWYERVIVDGARQFMQQGTYVRSGLAALPMDERNARIAAESQTRPWEEVLAESEQVFQQLLTVIAAVSDELLNDPRRLGLPADVVPWTLVAANSFEHYQVHVPDIRAWLDLSQAADGM